MEEIKSTEKLFLIEQSIKKFMPIINKAADAQTGHLVRTIIDRKKF